MAVVSYTQCDLCKSTENVAILQIEYGRKAWQLDACQDCFDRHLADVVKKGGRPSRRATGRKVTYEMKKIDLDPESL